MKLRLLSAFAFVAALVLAGCESSIKERFADAPPQTKEFEASSERVYGAAQDAFRRLDFKIGWKAMGRIDAASSIHHSQALGNSRQLTAKLRFRETSPGKTEVELWLTQEVAGDQYASYRKPLPESDFYAIYFATLQQFLDVDGGPLGSEKK